MKAWKKVVVASAVVLLTSSAAWSQTNDWKKKTQLTFSGPVQIPGKTLEAGTYTFRVMDLLADRHVLQVLDKDEAHLITTIMAVSRPHPEPEQKNVVMFTERPAGTPVAVQTWYYPGNPIGDEFVYSRTEAMAIAKRTHTGVLSREDDKTDEESVKSSKVIRIDENGNPVKDDDEHEHGDHHDDKKK